MDGEGGEAIMTNILSLLSLLLAPTTGQVADVFGKVDGWTIQKDERDAVCGMIGAFDSGTVFVVRYSKSTGNLAMSLSNPAWQSLKKEGQLIKDVKFSLFDEDDSFLAAWNLPSKVHLASDGENELRALNFWDLKPELLSHLQKSSSAEFRRGGILVEAFQISRAAVEQLQFCAHAMMIKSRDPFAR